MPAPDMLQRSKVPEVTLMFWLIKVLTTGMGETTSDYLVGAIDPRVAVLSGGGALLACLILQFAMRRYIPWVYWLAVVMVAIFGTMVADVIHTRFGVPYSLSTPVFAAALALTFWVWHRSEGTLSIHSIHTRRREVFYWAAVLATFALGTAAGDLLAHPLGLGFLGSGLLFLALILLPILGWWKFGLPEIPAFWAAYVLTRPLGASFADWMGVPVRRSGLGWGTGPVSLVLGLIIVGLVAYISVVPRAPSHGVQG